MSPISSIKVYFTTHFIGRFVERVGGGLYCKEKQFAIEVFNE